MVHGRTADGQLSGRAGKAPRYDDCPEDCPRCNRCPPTDLRRMIIDALIIETELEKQRYEADGLQYLLPPTDWHELVEQALAKS